MTGDRHRKSPSSRASPTEGRRVGAIDGLRGAAAISVLLFHLWLYARPDPPAAALGGVADWAWSSMRWGLILFFVLSGFLLYRPWSAAASGGPKPDLRRYARTRAARILPAYYLALAGSVLLLWESGAVPGVRLPPAESVPLFLVFAQNLSSASLLTLDPPLWTLAVEVSFYVALPLIGFAALRLSRRGAARVWVPLALLAVGMAWSWTVTATGGPLILTKLLPEMLPFFAVGMLAAALSEARVIGTAVRRTLAAAVVLCILLQLGAEALAPALSAPLHELPVALAAAALIVIASSPRPPRVLTSRPLVRVGMVSYGLYLWHVPVLWWLRSRGLLPLDPVAALPVVLVPSLVLAAASWRFVERPAIEWSRRRRLPVRPPSTALPLSRRTTAIS